MPASGLLFLLTAFIKSIIGRKNALLFQGQTTYPRRRRREMRITHGVRNLHHYGLANRRLFDPLGRGSAENYMEGARGLATVRVQGSGLEAVTVVVCRSTGSRSASSAQGLERNPVNRCPV